MLEFNITKLRDKIKEVGWKGLPAAVNKHVNYKTRNFTEKFYFKNVLQNKVFAKAFPFKWPKILLLSERRSGSSWIATMLSYSPDIAYLHEPISHGFIDKYDYNYKQRPFFSSEKERQKIFKSFADQSFMGIPPVPFALRNREDFFPLNRGERNLLIKEVSLEAGVFLQNIIRLK